MKRKEEKNTPKDITLIVLVLIILIAVIVPSRSKGYVDIGINWKFQEEIMITESLYQSTYLDEEGKERRIHTNQPIGTLIQNNLTRKLTSNE